MILEYSYELIGCLDCDIRWCFVGHEHLLWQEFNGIGFLFRLGFVYEHSVAVVVFKRRSQIPSIIAMRIPRLTLCWLLCRGGLFSSLVAPLVFN